LAFTGVSRVALARETVDAVGAVAALMTRLLRAVVDVQLTVMTAESRLTGAPVSVHVVHARAAVETRRLETLVHLQLTDVT